MCTLLAVVTPRGTKTEQMPQSKVWSVRRSNRPPTASSACSGVLPNVPATMSRLALTSAARVAVSDEKGAGGPLSSSVVNSAGAR